MRTLFCALVLLALSASLALPSGCGSTRVRAPADQVFGTPRGGVPEAPQPPKTPPLILGPEDVLSVEIWRQDDMTRQVKADRQGNVHLPLAGRVNIAGQTLDWLRYELTERYKKYYQDPRVLVSLVDSPLQKAFVLGEVKNPGSFKITGATSVLQLVAQAGGFTGDADLDAVILVRGDLERARVVPLDLRAAVEKGDLSQDWYLLRGDIVYVNKTAIADVEQFAKRLTNIINPAYLVERSAILGAIAPKAVIHGRVASRISF